MDRFQELLLDLAQQIGDALPETLLAITLFVLGVLIIKTIKQRAIRRISAKAKNVITARFIAEIIAAILYVILIIACFNILGWGSFTTKILAGAGLTTFIIGFALKDIGENFLAGIVMAFNRPFEMGDIIEIDREIGRVIRISLRETTIKSLDGKDVFIPNADILKKPLKNYTIDDLLRGDFDISVFNNNDIRKVIQLIEETVKSFQEVLAAPAPGVNIANFNEGLVLLNVRYWYKLGGKRAMNARLRTRIMLAVLEALKNNDVGMPDHVQDIKLNEEGGISREE
jgi:small conductance mechanosensitive channel